MNGRKHNLPFFSCALGMAFATLAVGGTVACDSMGDTEARVYSGGSVELTIAGDDESSSGDEGGTTDEPETTAEPETAGEGDGCTLTQGYWKNHSSHAKNKSQKLPWPISEETELCGQSWYEILKTPPKGDAWYIVAHQWIAASLNVAAGAAVTPEVAAALTAGEAYLADCEISNEEHADALAGKDVLDAFNNGDIGPGHCGDDVPGFDPDPETGSDTGSDTGDDTGDDTGTTGDPLPIPG